MSHSIYVDGDVQYKRLPMLGKMGRLGIEIQTAHKLLSMGYTKSNGNNLREFIKWAETKYAELKEMLGKKVS